MSGYCPKCGNTICICDEYNAEKERLKLETQAFNEGQRYAISRILGYYGFYVNETTIDEYKAVHKKIIEFYKEMQ